MATQTTDQQNALKDAMARAKQIAAKLQQQASGGSMPEAAMADPDESRKRSFQETFGMVNTESVKRPDLEGVDHTDPKVIAQQVANSLVQRAGLGSMLVQEVTIPNKLVGLVIGRGGEMINKLQSDSGAKIQVAPDPPAELAHLDRQVTITGMADAVKKAKNIIEEIKMEGKIPERLLIGSGNPGEYALEMQIAAGKVGLIIGKGGETIKSLQERAGCKMVLFQDGEFSNAPEKPLKISGEQSKVMYGKQLVQDLLTAKELEAINPEKRNQETGGNYDEVQVPREAVGFVIGAKGASINQIQQMTGCRIQFKNDMEGDFKVAMLNGTPQQVSMGKLKLNEILQSHQERRSGNWSGPRGPRQGWGMQDEQSGPFNSGGPGPRPGWDGPGPQGPGGPRNWGPGNRGPAPFGGGDLQPGHKHMVIHVPANKCGLVIGKGGETLKFIHSETKVNIEINREVPEVSPFRVFHLRGTEEQVEQAQSIIRDKIGDQSVTVKTADGEPQPAGTGQTQWGGPGGGWNQPNQQQWGGPQGGWNQQQPPQQQWNQQGNWNQPGWDQQQQQQQPPAQQWQAPQGQWQNQQQQWGQQQQGFPSATPQPTPASSDPTQQQNAPAGGQQDYSAAWALYYQQQQQYYQQYGMQPPAAAPATTAPAAQSPETPTSNASQSQAMADYQTKLAEYYKSFGQQQQQQTPPH